MNLKYLLNRTRKEGDCLIWTGPVNSGGYPQHNRHAVHRRILELKLERPIHPELECCHICDNTRCINPEHLYEGTHLDNIRDAKEKGRMRGGSSSGVRVTHCPHGHEYTIENTITAGKVYKRRECRTCKRDRMRERRNQNR